jgi:hypothetical protein
MDKEGLLNPEGLWSKRGALLAGLIAGAAIVGFNYAFFEQLLAALVIFTVLWAPLLAVIFLLALLERGAELWLLQLKKRGRLSTARATAREMIASMAGPVLRRRLMESFAELRLRGAKAALVRSPEPPSEWRRQENHDHDSRLPRGQRAA